MKKLNNKGFSLVELIIVIAIMAILVGVVGSQVIPYLENSRKAKDIQVLSSWNTSAMSAYSGAAAIINSDADYTITMTGASDASGKIVVDIESGKSDTYDSCKAIRNAFLELTGLNIGAAQFDFATGATPAANSKFESKAGKSITKVVITIKKQGGMQMDIKTGDSKYNFDSIYSK